MDLPALETFLRTHPDIARVGITRVQGSAPREEGAEMLVAPEAVHGTIGGGQLEYMAIDAARAMLARGEDRAAMDVPLGPEIGQCCGGRVVLALERLDPTARAQILIAAQEAADALPHVYIIGAGHVGRALAGLMALLPVRAILVDGREAELGLCAAAVEKRLSPLPEAEIRTAPPGSAFVVLTHDHALDFLVTAEALARGDAAYVGLIGSATKRTRFRRFLADQGGAPATRLVCPIGAQGAGDKRPAVIAAFVAAEIMAVLTAPDQNSADGRWAAARHPSDRPQEDRPEHSNPEDTIR